MPEWCKPKLPDLEEMIEVRARDASSSWAGYIRYQDAKGEASARRIICRRIEGYGKAETIAAYCCERKAPRQFRIDRIEELVCLDTGEVLDPMQHFEALRLHGALTVVDKSLNDFARSLVFMARCDGHVHPLEVESVERAIERYIVRFGGDDRMYEQAVRNAGRIAPDGEDLVTSLKRLGQHPQARELGRLMLSSVAEVTAADGELHADEIEWAGLVQDVLKGMAVG